ncbi:dephospho-CoA kinase [bacterium CG17_big_fil_post_rev_8_21_14_2_50_64_8]|nr:MAG: dephospho-CoA kinase [bacterium CG17_big_fil_post_rev_8_21_14_2_50_64_8]PJA76952.1 MAG: dephospho-CoA kinase [bacterium CG_4_9_14_3_um_filter_65_15]
MKTVAVTGPVCGGKSTLAGLLVARGGTLVDADRLGHEVLEQTPVREALAGEFGAGILANGRIDRGKLGDLVFADDRALATLNRLTHPPLAALIDARLEELAQADPGVLAVLEAAVYFLLPIRHTVDLVVTVTAEREVRLQRLQDRSGMGEDAAAARVAAQASLFSAWNRADLVIVNDGSPSELEAAVLSILDRLGTGDPPPSPRFDPDQKAG